ncbi:MAG TPA: cobalt ECF transporter T component CbiQ [Candidatus Sulfopaludibacter sp.]|jgi:cobalt ECF transporter T component CbiQ|nr:cobalt ECF transporter T component CbiQ [Candidatus Sulfopaludibacter sp.]
MSGNHVHQKPHGNFVEHTIAGLHAALARALYADDLAASDGLLQRLDPRVKLGGLLALILATALSFKLWVIAAILVIAVALAAASALTVRVFGPVWLSVITFTGAIALPALFLTPGDTFYRFPNLEWPITWQGLTSAGFLILRAETSATLALLLVFTTPWNHILKALRIFRVPVVFVVALGMTFRYILLLLETAQEMFESRKSRSVGRMSRGDYRRLAVSSGGVLLGKSFQLSGEVFLAMQSRGFRGEVYVLDDFRMNPRDWLALGLFSALAAASIWAGR